MKNKETINGKLKIKTINNEPSRTQQQFKEDVDVNNIIKKYKKTGHWPITGKTPRYGDFSKVADYQSALQSVIDAQNAFMELPSQIRAKFQNDPQQLLTFLDNAENLEEAISLGLAERREQKEQNQTKKQETEPVKES